MLMNDFFVLQKSTDPSVFYKERLGSRQQAVTPLIFSETTFDKAKRYKSISAIENSLERSFGNSIKGHISNFSDGLKIVRCKEVIQRDVVDSNVTDILREAQLSSNLVQATHYSTLKLFNMLRRSGKISTHKYFLSTKYDRMDSSKLERLFLDHELEFVKSGGNFAFDREEFLTAAQIICDVPFKSFNLGDN